MRRRRRRRWQRWGPTLDCLAPRPARHCVRAGQTSCSSGHRWIVWHAHLRSKRREGRSLTWSHASHASLVSHGSSTQRARWTMQVAAYAHVVPSVRAQATSPRGGGSSHLLCFGQLSPSVRAQTTSEDTTANVWSCTTGACQLTLTGHTISVALSMTPTTRSLPADSHWPHYFGGVCDLFPWMARACLLHRYSGVSKHNTTHGTHVFTA